MPTTSPASPPVRPAGRAAPKRATGLLACAALLALGSSAVQAQDGRRDTGRSDTGRSDARALPAPSIYLLPLRSLAPQPRPTTLAADSADTTDSADRTADAAAVSPPRSLFGVGSALSRASLVQMPSENVVPGRYTRPRYALGFRSNAMKNLAQGMGLDAEHCLAPLVRARVTLSQNGDTGGRLMIFARCTLR
jgi:hypothetical protein